MSQLVYLCLHCRSKKGHLNLKQVRACELLHKDNPTDDEILEFAAFFYEKQAADIKAACELLNQTTS